MFLQEYSLIMTLFIAGFIIALLLAAFVIIWITCFMFYKERHRPEHYQYDISDLKTKNIEIAQEIEREVEPKAKIDERHVLAAGLIILPRRHHHKDVYDSRPDYPESGSNAEDGLRQTLEIVADTAVDIIEDLETESQYQSEV